MATPHGSLYSAGKELQGILNGRLANVVNGGGDRNGFRCSFRVSIEVLLVMRFEQRANSWPHYPSERLGEGV